MVTGGAGFVGTHVALGVRRAYPNARVIALDNLKRRGSELNLDRLREHRVQFVHGDIRVPEDLNAVDSFDLLVDCSAEPSVLAGYVDAPRYVVDTNLAGTVTCLEAARAHGAAVVFLSTSRVYPIQLLRNLAYVADETRYVLEDRQPFPGVSARGISEAFPLDGHRSLYGASKLCSELLIAEYLAVYDMSGIVNRCGVIAGPWQMGRVDQGFVCLWVAQHLYDGKLSYIGFDGDGKQVRDVLHVDDLVSLVLRQIERLDAYSGETYNVGGGDVNVSLAELTKLCREITGRSIPIGNVPDTRPGDIPIYITDNAKVTQHFDWRPTKDMHAIVEDTAQWIRDHFEALRPVLT